MDLEFFFKNYTLDHQIYKGNIAQVEIIMAQFLFQFKLIFKENHSQISILFISSPTTLKFHSLEALPFAIHSTFISVMFISEQCDN